MPTKILGYEPVALIGVAMAALAFALTLTSLDTNTQGVIMAAAVAVGGLWGAWATQDRLLGALIAVVKTGAVLLATLHYSFSETSQAALISAITIGVSMLFHRQVTTPLAKIQDAAAAGALYGNTAYGGVITVTNPGSISPSAAKAAARAAGPARDAKGHFAKKGTPPEHSVS
jgi:hypothetical protein